MRRHATAIALVAGLALGAGACGSDDDGDSAGGAEAAITFQVTGDPEETRVYRELADLYRRETDAPCGSSRCPSARCTWRS